MYILLPDHTTMDGSHVELKGALKYRYIESKCMDFQQTVVKRAHVQDENLN